MKRLGFLLILLLSSCIDEVVEPLPIPTTQKIFNLKESMVTDGQDIYFDLPSDGTYTLTLIDKENGQVLSRERFKGTSGENIKKIYTNSLQKRYLYLLLEDVTRKEIGKTTIITK